MYHFTHSLGDLGALERRSPLPAGRYAIDVVGDNSTKMTSWLASNKGQVRVESTEMTEGDDEASTITRYSFITSAPVTWPATTFGYPDIVTTNPADATSPVPTVNAPGPKTAKPTSSGITDNTTVLVMASVALLGLVIVSAMRHRKKVAA